MGPSLRLGLGLGLAVFKMFLEKEGTAPVSPRLKEFESSEVTQLRDAMKELTDEMRSLHKEIVQLRKELSEV